MTDLINLSLVVHYLKRMAEHRNRLIFHSFKEAALYAKKHPGMMVNRLESGKGWQVLTPKSHR